MSHGTQKKTSRGTNTANLLTKNFQHFKEILKLEINCYELVEQ